MNLRSYKRLKTKHPQLTKPHKPSYIQAQQEDYICITDIAKFKNPNAPADIIKNWLRSKNTIELLGLWEKLHNPDFKLVEFDQFKNEAGYNHFVLSPQKWIESTNTIGLKSKSGRYGGTFAHVDIALEFATWVSVEFKFYLIKEFQYLKSQLLVFGFWLLVFGFWWFCFSRFKITFTTEALRSLRIISYWLLNDSKCSKWLSG